MKRLLLITGDIAARKTTFSNQLAQRYSVAVFQKDTIKEILGDNIGFRDREENRKLSNAAVQLMAHLFWQIAQTGSDLILEANFHGSELEQLHELANRMQYRVLTLVLRGEAEILYGRYLHRMRAENRHPVHLSTTLDVKEDFISTAQLIRSEKIVGEALWIDACDFSYQQDEQLLRTIDLFMK